MSAYSAMRKIQDEQLRRLELPQANIAATVAQVQGAKVGLSDFLIYGRASREDDQFPPLAAAVALSLKADGRCPHPLVGVWPAVVEAVGKNSVPQLPERRMLEGRTEHGGKVWVVCPEWEGPHLRGVLCTHMAAPGDEVDLVDVDRPLLSPKRFRLPQFKPCVTLIEAKALLLSV